MNTETKQYEGKFVFLEAIKQDSKYHNGEYFCFRATPATLYCCKASVGYGGHEQRAMSLMGETGFTVIESWVDDKAAIEFANQQSEWANAVLSDPNAKRAWIESVYSCAAEVARNVKRCLAQKDVTLHIPEAATEAVFTVPKGVTKITLRFQP